MSWPAHRTKYLYYFELFKCCPQRGTEPANFITSESHVLMPDSMSPSSPSATIPYFLSLRVALSSRSSDYRKHRLKCLQMCFPYYQEPSTTQPSFSSALFFTLPNGLGPVLLLFPFTTMKFTFGRESRLPWCFFTFRKYSWTVPPPPFSLPSFFSWALYSFALFLRCAGLMLVSHLRRIFEPSEEEQWSM